MFAPNFHLLNLENRAPAAARAWFFKKSIFAIGIDFWSIWVPTCLHFLSQNPPKSFRKSILKGIDFSIDFSIDFFTIFGRLGFHLEGQVGAMLATFSAQDGSQDVSKFSLHFDLQLEAPATVFWRGLAECAGSWGGIRRGHRSSKIGFADIWEEIMRRILEDWRMRRHLLTI